jgi:hypothetical protein
MAALCRPLDALRTAGLDVARSRGAAASSFFPPLATVLVPPPGLGAAAWRGLTQQTAATALARQALSCRSLDVVGGGGRGTGGGGAGSPSPLPPLPPRHPAARRMGTAAGNEPPSTARATLGSPRVLVPTALAAGATRLYRAFSSGEPPHTYPRPYHQMPATPPMEKELEFTKFWEEIIARAELDLQANPADSQVRGPGRRGSETRSPSPAGLIIRTRLQLCHCTEEPWWRVALRAARQDRLTPSPPVEAHLCTHPAPDAQPLLVFAI